MRTSAFVHIEAPRSIRLAPSVRNGGLNVIGIGRALPYSLLSRELNTTSAATATLGRTHEREPKALIQKCDATPTQFVESRGTKFPLPQFPKDPTLPPIPLPPSLPPNKYSNFK